MSENRKRYSSAPLFELKNSGRNQGGGFQVPMNAPKEPRQPRHSQGNFTFLQVCMTLVLPLIFVVALILRIAEVHWGFIVLSLLALLVMWLCGAFIPQARKTMTLIYTALILVSFAAAMWFTTSLLAPAQDTTVPGTANTHSNLFGRDVTASQVGALSDSLSQSGVSSQTTPKTTPDSRSQAQERLELFMSSWMNLDYDAMLNYSSPAWKSAQPDPAQAIFKIRGTHTPTKYSITYVSGNESDDSRTVTMEAYIDRGDGNDPKRYRYEVLMLRVNGNWYVDPSSLSTATKIELTPVPTPVHTIIPTPTPNPNQVLYYNPNGGTFYHLDKECTSTAKKFLPFKGSFTYGQLSEYPSLKPCTKCHAPSR